MQFDNLLRSRRERVDYLQGGTNMTFEAEFLVA